MNTAACKNSERNYFIVIWLRTSQFYIIFLNFILLFSVMWCNKWVMVWELIVSNFKKIFATHGIWKFFRIAHSSFLACCNYERICKYYSCTVVKILNCNYIHKINFPCLIIESILMCDCTQCACNRYQVHAIYGVDHFLIATLLKHFVH